MTIIRCILEGLQADLTKNGILPSLEIGESRFSNVRNKNIAMKFPRAYIKVQKNYRSILPQIPIWFPYLQIWYIMAQRRQKHKYGYEKFVSCIVRGLQVDFQII